LGPRNQVIYAVTDFYPVYKAEAIVAVTLFNRK
jgi:hypothetical protein